MFRQMLRSKIHRATVTESCLDYEGSLTIDEDLMEAAGILPYEAIVCSNLNNGERFMTYAMGANAVRVKLSSMGRRRGKARSAIRLSSSVTSIMQKKKSNGMSPRSFKSTRRTGLLPGRRSADVDS